MKIGQNKSKAGRLMEMSPVGTGFIEDVVTGARYGFHVSMLHRPVSSGDAAKLDGAEVRFELESNGIITGVTTEFPSHP